MIDKYTHLMQHAIEIAQRAKGNTSPNPMVGAVIVDKVGHVVGEGWHKRAGEAHAEVNALNMAGDRAKGATMIVTLEPCSHHGRTPPCVQAIIKAQISHVVIATLDPNPMVAGRGVKILQEAGIQVDVGLMEQEAKQLNEVFFKWITTHIPYIACKFAMTLDGKIATASGKSKWITCHKAREFAHQLRATYDAILVGGNTLRMDDPELTCRLIAGRNPIRIIVSGSLNFDLNSKVFTDDSAPTIIVTNAPDEHPNYQALASIAHVEVLKMPVGHDISFAAMLKKLAKKDITGILVEGGSIIHAEFLKQNLVDKVYAVLAPKIIGGASAKGVIGELGVDSLDQAIELTQLQSRQLDNDILLTGYIKRGG